MEKYSHMLWELPRKNMKLKDQILDFMEGKGWMHDRPLRDLADISGHKLGTVARTCRTMANEGYLERDMCDCTKPKHVVYKFKQRTKEPIRNFNGVPI